MVVRMHSESTDVAAASLPASLFRHANAVRLPHLLLAVSVIELVLYRLAVPALAPTTDAAPPHWHAVLSYVGLFLFYFASALATLVVSSHLIRLVRERRLYSAPARVALALAGFGCAGLAARAMTSAPEETLSFVLEAAFGLSLLCVLAAQLARGGDLGVKVGLVLLVLPLLAHFWGPLAGRYYGEEALWDGLPDRVQSIGIKLLVIAAVASPYCFAPRPFLESASRPAPFAIGAFVGLAGAVIMRQSHAVGLELAANGLGIDLGAGAPMNDIVLYLLALSAITWSLAACLSAETASRRLIGVGLGLVVVSGYGFAWPLQYVTGLAGVLTIAAAGQAVVLEERGGGAQAVRFRPPPVADETWQAWLKALTARLAEQGGKAVTVRGETEVARSHVVATFHQLPVRLTVERSQGSVTGIDVLIGDPPDGGAPAWTMKARGARRLGLDLHPDPPAIEGITVKSGDPVFDRRFKLRERGEHTAALFDDGLRARAVASLDGWLALWPDRALRYRVHPGRGAPLDQPIPISELAFRGSDPAPTCERVAALLDLLAELAVRGGVKASDERAVASLEA